MYAMKIKSIFLAATILLYGTWAIAAEGGHPLGARITPPLPAESIVQGQKSNSSQPAAQGAQSGSTNVIGPRAIYANDPEVSAVYAAYSSYMADIPFDKRHRELAILVVAREWDSQYEWWAHESSARKAGISDAVIEAIRANRDTVFNKADEQIIYDYAHELVTLHRVNDAAYKKAWDLLDTKMLIKFTMLVGHYCGVAATLNAHKLAIPGGVKDPLPVPKPASTAYPEALSDDYVLMVFVKPVEARMAEFVHWYQDEHMPEVINRPGFVSGRRYGMVPDQSWLPKQAGPNPQMVQYNIKTAELEKVFAEDSKLSQAARLKDPPLDPTATKSYTYQRLGPEIKGSGPKSTGKGEAKTYKFISLNGPKEGVEDAFNRWYDNHVAEVIQTPGFVSGQRYKRSPIQRYSGADSSPYMVEYTIVTDDLQSVFEELNKRHDSFVKSDAIDSGKSSTFVCEALSPLMKRK